MKIKQSQIIKFFNGEKVPRKIKKNLLGTKVNKKTLKNRIKNVTVLKVESNGEVILSDYFCPKCGSDSQMSENHYVGYPEIWIDYYCIRCGNKVATQDNSPYVHCLQFPEYNFQID